MPANPYFGDPGRLTVTFHDSASVPRRGWWVETLRGHLVCGPFRTETEAIAALRRRGGRP